jgi:hypothetical protein
MGQLENTAMKFWVLSQSTQQVTLIHFGFTTEVLLFLFLDTYTLTQITLFFMLIFYSLSPHHVFLFVFTQPRYIFVVTFTQNLKKQFSLFLLEKASITSIIVIDSHYTHSEQGPIAFLPFRWLWILKSMNIDWAMITPEGGGGVRINFHGCVVLNWLLNLCKCEREIFFVIFCCLPAATVLEERAWPKLKHAKL